MKVEIATFEKDGDQVYKYVLLLTYQFQYKQISSYSFPSTIFLFSLINKAYEVEDGNTGVAFKKMPRLLHPFDSGLDTAYKNERVLKAVNDTDDIVGCVVFDLVEKNGFKYLYFGPFAVYPHLQGQGIGGLLLAELRRIGLECGANYFEITVVNHRTDLLPYYQKLGFTIQEEVPFEDIERITRPCTFFVMTKPLVL